MCSGYIQEDGGSVISTQNLFCFEVKIRVEQKLCQSYCYRKSEKEKVMELLGRYWWWPVVLVLVHFGMNGCWEQERIALLQYKASTINYIDEYHFTPWEIGRAHV